MSEEQNELELSKILENIENDRKRIYEILEEHILGKNEQYIKNIPKILDVIVRNNEQLLKLFLARKNSDNIEDEDSDINSLYKQIQEETK